MRRIIRSPCHNREQHDHPRSEQQPPRVILQCAIPVTSDPRNERSLRRTLPQQAIRQRATPQRALLQQAIPQRAIPQCPAANDRATSNLAANSPNKPTASNRNEQPGKTLPATTVALFCGVHPLPFAGPARALAKTPKLFPRRLLRQVFSASARQTAHTRAHRPLRKIA